MAIIKIVKTSVALIGLAATTYFVFTLYKDHKKNEAIRVVEEQKQIRIALEFAAIKGFAEVFAKCTANSLSDKAMEEFIIYETMPLGLAWMNANLNSYPPGQPLQHASILFYNYARALGHRPPIHDLSEGYIWPSSVVYAAISSPHDYRGQSLGDIKLGNNDLSWPPFESLKNHCKTKESVKESALYAIYGIGKEPKRHQMKTPYWEALSETKLFKAAQEKVNSQNQKIIDSIMQENTKQVEKENNDQQSADHWIFKKP